jgi:predicted DNA-binding transcriptional regulator AlpA
MKEKPKNDLLNQKEAAEYLGTTVESLNSLRYQGRNTLPCFRWGNRIKYRKADLDAWIESRLENKGDLQ